MNINNYLTRINYTGKPTPNFATLKQLQENHLKNIPYENLDIMRNIPISLEPEHLYQKIVTRKRGGYCFELNGLFAWLLRKIGFKVRQHFSRYLRYETTLPKQRHTVLTVCTTENDQQYLCDVGMGTVTSLTPIPLIFGKVMGEYKLEKEDFLENVLYERVSEVWRRVYSFTEQEQINADFIAPSFYCENHPDSYFRTMDMVHVFTDDGRKSVAGREFKVITPKGVNVLIPGSEEVYKNLLKDHFNIII